MCTCFIFFSLVHFKGKSDTDPSKKKKKQKKKNLKEKCGDEKTPKPQHKPPPAVAQKSLAGAKPTTQTGTICGFKLTIKCQEFLFFTSLDHFFFVFKGGNVATGFSTVDVLRKRLHEKIEESRGQVCRFKYEAERDIKA